MRKMKKFVAVGLSAMMLAGTFAACGSKDEGTTAAPSTTPSANEGGSNTTDTVTDVALTVWAPQEEQEFLKTQCEAFNAAHPEWNITFEYGVCSEADAKGMVTQDVEQAADVFYYANDQISDLVQSGVLAKFVGTYKDEIIAANGEAFTGTAMYNGEVYGVPFTPNTWYMYYNKDVFTEDDVKSFDTMLEKAKISFPLTNAWYLGAFYLANGTLFGELGGDASAGTSFGDEMGIATTKYLVEVAKHPNFMNTDKVDAFINGDVAACFTGTWEDNNIREALGDKVGVTIAPTVNIDGVVSQLRPFGGSKCIGVNTQTGSRNNQVQATALAVFLGSEEVQKARYEARQTCPTIASIQTGSETADAQAKQLQYTFPQPVIPEMTPYWDRMAVMGNEINNGDVTAENAEEKTKKLAEDLVSSGL